MYFVIVQGEKWEYDKKEDAEKEINSWLEEDVEPEEITLIKGEEIKFKLRAKIE